jgi:hypothetical protein
VVRWDDVEIADSPAVQVRREMEEAFSPVTHTRTA